MNAQRAILSLFGVLLVLVAALYFAIPKAPPSADRLWIPVLSKADAGLKTITIEKGELATMLINQEGQWRVSNRLDYPARVRSMIDLVEALRSAQLVERKTSKPAHHAQLQLSEEGEDATRATRITLDLGSEAGATLLVGQVASQRDATFVRSPGDDQVWLVSGKLTASANPSDWLDPSLFDIPDSSIASISVKPPSVNEGYTLVRQEGALNWSLAEMPKDLTLKYSSVLNQIPDRLTQFKLIDVAKPLIAPAVAQTVIDVLLKDGRVLQLHCFEESERYWLTAQVRQAAERTEPSSSNLNSEPVETIDLESPPSLDLNFPVPESMLPGLRFEISANNFATLTKPKSDYFDSPTEDS